jgi:hypothetical protein
MNNTKPKRNNLFTNAYNTMANAASDAVNTMANTANAVVEAANNTAEAAVNAAKNLGTNFQNAATNVIEAAPEALNSLIPLNRTAAPTNNKKNQEGANTGLLGAVMGNQAGPAALLGAVMGNNNKKTQNAATTAAVNNKKNQGVVANVAAAVNEAVNKAGMNTGANTDTWYSWLFSPLGIFMIIAVVFLAVFAIFSKQIRQGYGAATLYIRQVMGLETRPDVISEIVPAEGTIKEVTVPPVAPQEAPLSMEPSPSERIVEKILPVLGGNEVFNVAQNKFTFYDAEPLCKALGAELATYEQVKDAWSKGADWCNYGWVKGQMAVYPTQKDTYEKLQGGPPDEKNACGTVGINGGFFDNPELRYGVNCYGPKPPQTAHDEKMLMEQGKIARSPDTLKVDKLIAEYKSQADSLFVKPFNDGKWSSS